MKANMINTNSVMKTICAVVMLLGMSVSAWGADETLTVTGSLIGSGSGYGSSSGKDLATNASHNVSIVYTDVLKGQSYVQLKNSTGILYSKSLPASSSNNKIKTITIATVTGTGTINLYGSTATDNTGWSAIPYTENTATDVSSYAYKTFKIESSGGYASTNSVTVVYTQASPQTVTFEKEGGTFDDPSVFTNTNQITEASGGAGVTLPLVNPSDFAASMGWGFYGWATSAVTSPTTTAPAIVGKAGDMYYPQSATTLHAVFAKGEFTLISSESEITDGGKYLIAGWYNEQVHVMTSTYIHTDDYYMKEKVVAEYTSGKIRAIDVEGTWRYIITGSHDAYFIQDVVNATNNYLDTYNLNWYNCSYSSTHSFKIRYGDNGEGSLDIYNNLGAYPYIVLLAAGDFQSHANPTWHMMRLYKETTECKFASDPKIVKLVASPAEGGLVDLYLTSNDEEVFSDEYVDLAEAAANDGYDFLRWETGNATNAKFSDGAAYTLTSSTDDDPEFKATGDVILTAYFYQHRSVTYNLTGLTKLTGTTTVDAATNASGFTATFSVNAHYRTTPLTCSVTMGGSELTEGAGNDYTWNASTKTLTFPAATDITGDLVVSISAEETEYTKYAFSCAELTLTPHLATTGTPIFITSTASKTVRSQDYIQITGSGLTPNSDLSFPNLNSKFAVLTASGGTLSTDENGSIDEAAYIFYTPAADATTDGIDEMSGLTVSVGGAKPKQASLVQSIIGRHLPAKFVIAAKRNNKWYALPDTMTVTGTPKPIEIAVDDIDNPSLAYTTADTKYSLEGPAAGNISGGVGQYVKLVMNSLWVDDADHTKGHAPLFGSATKTPKIGKSGPAQATNNLSAGWWWKLVQTNTSITNPQDAKYLIFCANNDTTLSMKENAGNPIWGLYKSGIDELRLIPASDVAFTEAEVVEWGQHGAIIEVDATAATGIDATSVIAHLNGASSAAITLVETRASDAKNRSSKYNYTVNFGDGIDFAAAASNGAMLRLEWKKDATVKAMSNIVVPKIVATSATMSSLMATDDPWNTADVHVLPGVTMTANAGDFSNKDVVIDRLEIYPGATVKVTKGSQDVGTLKVRTLVLRNGWTRVSGKNYNVARLYVSTDANLAKSANENVWYSDWYIDYDQYYPIAVPFPVATNNISYKNSNSAATAGVRLRYYSGALRATNIQQNQDANWVEYNWNGSDPAMPTNLEPSHGYIMTARRPTGKAFSIVRMPLTFSNEWTALGEKGSVGETHKDQVTVTAYGDESTPSYAKGWNIIANPYMAVYTGTIEYGDETKVNVVNIPDVDFREYDQVATATAKLKPGSAFLVQAPKTGVVTFGAANRQLSMPSYRREVREETEPEQQAYIVLSNEEAEDMMGIFVSDKYTAEYDLNGDVEKMLSGGTTLRTYMRYNDMNMAYVAIDKVLAQEPIPVSVRIPNDGEYTFSLHEASIVANLEGIYLIDHYEGNRETNLLEENYMFYSPAGTIADRFTINAKVGARDVPTDIDVTDAEKNSGKALKFLYRDKLYIIRSGRIYDATGKQVKGGAQ